MANRLHHFLFPGGPDALPYGTASGTSPARPGSATPLRALDGLHQNLHQHLRGGRPRGKLAQRVVLLIGVKSVAAPRSEPCPHRSLRAGGNRQAAPLVCAPPVGPLGAEEVVVVK